MTALLRAVRKQRGLTLEALAQQTGLTKSYLSKIERRCSTPPRMGKCTSRSSTERSGAVSAIGVLPAGGPVARTFLLEGRSLGEAAR